jgi:hypothetical protein
MVVPPIPIPLPLASRCAVPIYGRMVPLLPVHMPGTIFMIVPFVVVLVTFVVKPMIVVIMVLRDNRKWKDKRTG